MFSYLAAVGGKNLGFLMKEGLDGGCGWLVVGLMEPGIEMVTGRLLSGTKKMQEKQDIKKFRLNVHSKMRWKKRISYVGEPRGRSDISSSAAR